MLLRSSSRDIAEQTEDLGPEPMCEFIGITVKLFKRNGG